MYLRDYSHYSYNHIVINNLSNSWLVIIIFIERIYIVLLIVISIQNTQL